MFPQDADSPIWIPDRLIRPAVAKQEKEKTVAEAEKAAPAANEESETKP